MPHDDQMNGNAATGQTSHRMVSELANQSGATLPRVKDVPGAMREQGHDWARNTSCIPQKFVRLVGYRDPDARPSTPLPQRPMPAHRARIPTDTPIG